MIGYCPVEEEATSTGSSLLLSEKMEEAGFHQPENQLHQLKYGLFLKIGFH